YENQPTLEGTSVRTSNRAQNSFGYELSLDFKREFARKGEELVANVSYGTDDEDGSQSFNQEFSNANQLIDKRLNDEKEDEKNINIQLDYTLPFSEDSRFEAGYRSIIQYSKETQISDSFDPKNQTFVRDYDLTNAFDMED